MQPNSRVPTSRGLQLARSTAEDERFRLVGIPRELKLAAHVCGKVSNAALEPARRKPAMAPVDSLAVEVLAEADPRRDPALRLVLADPGDSLRQATDRVRRLTAHLTDQGLQIGAIAQASASGLPVSAAMVIESPGNLGSVFLPRDPSVASRAPAIVAVLTALKRHARSVPLVLLQALLSAEERYQGKVYAQSGFERLAELAYLERTASQPCPASGRPGNFTFSTFTPQSESLFLEVLARTYDGSRDCPRLTGVRRTEEVMAAHRATGSYDPNHWFVVRLDDEPAGILLLAGVPGRRAFEVVYVGVVPQARGRGVGDALIKRAVGVCRRHGNADLTLAVDGDNEPAMNLYRRWCFREVSRREAWVWINPNRP